MARFLVTGGAGFIGSHLVRALVKRGDDVRVFDDLSSGHVENLDHVDAKAGQLELSRGDLCDPDSCARACEGVDGIFHNAGQVSLMASVEDPKRTYAVNVMGTLHLLEGARRSAVRRIVFASSCAVYGRGIELPKDESLSSEPCSPYASSKLAAEQLMQTWFRLHGVETICLRYFNVFGPRQADDNPYSGVVAIFARKLLEGRAPTIFGDGEQTRDFVYVDDVVEANLAAMQATACDGTPINVGSGERISIKQVFGEIRRIVDSGLEASYAPARDGDIVHSLACLHRARHLLGYTPKISLREGLERTLGWYAQRR